MKLLLLGSMLFTGGSAVAMENEQVNGFVNDTIDHAQQFVQNRLGKRLANTISETGFPYPSETALANLTEEQAFAITSEIDLINAEYDWANMTEDEISVALEEVHARLEALHEELGIEMPQIQNQYKGANGKRDSEEKGNFSGQNKSANENNRLYDGECPNETEDSDKA